jgi:hypothetical protein
MTDRDKGGQEFSWVERDSGDFYLELALSEPLNLNDIARVEAFKAEVRGEYGDHVSITFLDDETVEVDLEGLELDIEGDM